MQVGVRAKLMLAFAGMAAMTVAASAVGLMSFSAVERPMAQIADTSLPEMELATRLAGESGAIASAAPMLDGAGSQEERESLRTEAQERARGFLSLVDELAGRRPQDPLLSEVRETGNALIATLDSINDVFMADARFKDPFNDVRGVAHIRKIFADMFKTVGAPDFTISSYGWSDNHDRQAFLRWKFIYRVGGKG